MTPTTPTPASNVGGAIKHVGWRWKHADTPDEGHWHYVGGLEKPDPAGFRPDYDDLVTYEKVYVPVPTPISFGLEAQGHIPAIKRMIEGGRDWPFIGRAINCDGATARAYYEQDLARRAALNPTPATRALSCASD